MRVYADSSFLVKLVAREAGTEAAVAEYRRLEHPCLPFLPLHDLEVRNAILQKAFFERRSLRSGERVQVAREKAAAQSRLDRLLERGAFRAADADWERGARRARNLAETYTERTGARVYDLLHVAFALEMEHEIMLTTDDRQAKVARSEGLKVILAADSD